MSGLADADRTEDALTPAPEAALQEAVIQARLWIAASVHRGGLAAARAHERGVHAVVRVARQLGELSYDREQNQLGVHWPLEENAASRQRYLASMNKVAAESGGVVFGEEWLGLKPAAWHPLGGAVMSEACSERGELLGHEHLYVVDGSLLPGSAGAANPALTVAANAERIMDQLIPILRDS